MLRLSLGVVPAKAGTHNHRALLFSKPSTISFHNFCRGVWVPAFAGTTEDGSFSRRNLRPSFAISLSLSRNRGRRECRVRAAPAVSCAKKCAFGAHEHTGERKHSDIPCATALRLTSCSPRWSGLVVTVIGEKLPARTWRQHRGARTTRLRRTQQTRLRQKALPGYRHSPMACCVHRIPRPTCRDDGDTPLRWARDGVAYNSDFQKWQAKYFCLPDWTTQISLRLLRKLDFRRNGFATCSFNGA